MLLRSSVPRTSSESCSDCVGQTEVIARAIPVKQRLDHLLFASLLDAAERGKLPDTLVRWGIRQLIKARLHQLDGRDTERSLQNFLQATRNSPIAITPQKANEQHYELPSKFFRQVLGRRLKYSCCYWPKDIELLDDAEEHALSITCQHADLHDGQDILELGCGWGSLTLWMAEKYPNARITAVSNSHSQRDYIEQQAVQRAITNLNVITADMNVFEIKSKFDRVVSVEMFEHMRNHSALMQEIHSWLNPQGKLFTHIFCHKNQPYLFHSEGKQNWMGRYFFTGGMMPSANYLPMCESSLQLESQWTWDGTHYAKTCRAWLNNQDTARDSLKGIFNSTYGNQLTNRWYNRWRLFFMACEELFAFNGGNEWFVSHYLFERAK